MVEFKETEVKKIDKIFVSAAGLRSLADRLEAQFKDTKTEVAVDLYVVPSGENKAIGFDFSAYLKKEDPKPAEAVKTEPEVKETPVVDPNVSTDDKKAPEATVATPEEVEKQKKAEEDAKKVAEEQKIKEEAAKKEEEIKKNADAVKAAAEKLMSTEETK